MAGQNLNSPTEFQYFFEDEVFKINSRGQVVFGLVLENFEANSSDQDSDIDVPIQKGEIRVVWHPSGIERVMSEKSVGLADRSLMPGDVVRRMIKGKDTQRGYCRDIIVSAAVQVVGTNLVLPSVISQRLQPIEEFTADLAVCLDSWVGTTKIVHSKMRLSSADGSRLEYPDVSTCPLEDCLTRRRRGGRGLSGHAVAPEYFPGQYVAGPLGALDHANWLNTTKDMKAARKHKMREHKFTVEAVETESVGVQWQCRALGESSDNGPPQQPRFLVEGDDLKRLRLLNLFEPCTIQVGARNFLNLTPEDNFCTKSQWKKNQGKSYRAIRRLTRPPRNKDTKEINSKDPSGNSAQSQDANATGKHTYRLSAKSKKRLSIHSRDCKIVCAHNAQSLPSLENKQHACKEATSDDKICPSKMDVDIVIVDSEPIPKDGLNKFESAVSNSSKVDCKAIENLETSNDASGSPQRTADSGPRLTVPDSAWNGKSSPSDPSCSPEYADPSEKHKKLRKSRLCNSIHSGNDNLSMLNGDHKSADEHHAELDDSDNWDNTSTDDVTDTDSCATWSSHCSSSNNSLASGRGKKSPQLVTKFLKGKRLKRSAKKDPVVPHPKPGDKLVVEILCTTSKANVVWQDGTIELGIPSTDLFPIHHLDGQECFPGDFVVGGSGIGESAPSHRDYGVVQRVDHHGRTAVVKWFRTYTSCQEPVPKMIAESEVSVYDLKDHPDFQYRPGTVVIRVANFTGTEASCTAGQVIDNFPSGRVHVWWVDGHSSMCWPQDLFKVGEYDSDEGDFWADDGTASDDSWETQSSGGSGVDKTERIISYSARNIEIFGSLEGNFDLLVDGALPSLDAVPANPPAGVGEFPKVPRSLEPRAAAHIERGRAAMAKLEEMFSQNPALQNQEIMRKLLNLYKDCRFLDKLMGTSFFHEDHFQGLLERVRERGGSSRESGIAVGSGTRKVQNQVMRLFSRDDGAIDLSKTMLTNIKDTEAVRDLNPTNTSNGQKESSPKLDSKKKSDLDVSPIPQVEISNLSLIGDQFSNVLYSIEGVKCETKDDSMDASLICNSYPPNHSSSMVDAKSPNTHSNMEIDSEKTCNILITSPSRLKEPTIDSLRPLSSSSDGSVSKYATPAGSLGDLAGQLSQEEKSPSGNGKTAGTEDSGMESQSVSISQSANNTVSSNGEYECSFQSTEFNSQDCAAPPGALTAPRAAHMSSSPDTQLSTRNVCLKLCSLINIQMMKACAEVSRRRCLVLADFLNKVMSVENTSGTPLPYRFSVQYDALVVNMTDSKNEPGKENIEENKMETSEGATETTEAIVKDEKTQEIGTLQSKETKECDSHPITAGPSKNISELGEGFIVMESAPSCHRFRLSLLQPSEPRIFHQAVRREIKLLNSDLPPGVWVRGYEDRMDLLSIMIGGPAKTPYEDGLFLFDVQLGGEYPRAPPLCYYISYCSDRLNPNLYEDGKVCVSLLGTWSGHGVELWGRDSSLLQVIVSLQGLILCAEPYFNEAGYDKQKGSQQGNENSRMYNEMVLLKLVQSLTKLIGNPPEVFCQEILSHQKHHAAGLCDRLERWMLMSEEHNRTHPESPLTPDSFRDIAEESDFRPPEYPLIPASRGFCLTLRSSLESYRNALKRANIAFEKEL